MDKPLWNKLYVDLIVPCKICKKWKEALIIKSVIMIKPGTGWFEVTQHNNNKAIKNANLVDTKWMSRYPWPTEIMYDHGREFLGHKFKNTLFKMNTVFYINQQQRVNCRLVIPSDIFTIYTLI